jgi:hypothetical protein
MNAPPIAGWTRWLPIVTMLASAMTLAYQQRDVRAVPAGTAEISGVVWTSDMPRQPLRRAVVTISGEVLPDARSVITDDSGRFTIGRLPSGIFMVTARKSAHLEARYGAARPGRPGSPIVLTAGQRVTIDITMIKGGVIAGTLRTPSGTPLAGVPVVAADVRDVRPAALLETRVSTTDDRGAYRIYGLMPGEYVIVATPKYEGTAPLDVMSTGDMENVLATLGRRQNQTTLAKARETTPAPAAAPVMFAPVYFPGTAHYSDAARLSLAPGEERDGVSFEVNYVPVVSIEGTIAGDVPNLASTQLSMILPGPRIAGLSGPIGITTRPPNDRGEFSFGNVPPGRYRIVVRARRGPATFERRAAYTGEQWFAVADVDVRGQDVKGVFLPLQSGGTLAGKVVFDGPAAMPGKLDGIRVTLIQPGGNTLSYSGGTVFGSALTTMEPVNLVPDGTFRIIGIGPASYTLNVMLPQELRQTWRVRSAMVDGLDLLDEPIDGPAVSIAGVTVTLTNKRTELAGTLQSASGQPTAEYFIIAFSQDRRHWRTGARRSQSTRPATNGRFHFTDLPPGDYFLAALTDLDPNAWQDPSFLEQAVQAAIKLTVVEGQTTVQDVRIK